MYFGKRLKISAVVIVTSLFVISLAYAQVTQVDTTKCTYADGRVFWLCGHDRVCPGVHPCSASTLSTAANGFVLCPLGYICYNCEESGSWWETIEEEWCSPGYGGARCGCHTPTATVTEVPSATPFPPTPTPRHRLYLPLLLKYQP